MSWKNVEFAHPWVLSLIPISLILLLIFTFKRPKGESAIFFPWLQLISISPLNQIRVWLRRICIACMVVGWALWLVALARPQRPEDISRSNVLGVDMMLVLDTSGSMEFEDLKPNRFSVAVDTMEHFIRQRKADRMGLIVFGGESFTLCPLTLDHDILVHSLKTARTEMTRVQGTAIGVALANAVARLKDSKAKSRAIILLTDGANNAGSIDPLTAGELAKGYGIKIYSIGVGHEGMVPVPIKGVDIFGRPTKYYRQMESSLDNELLNQLATRTSGETFRAEDAKTLAKVFDKIDELEKTKLEGLKLTRVTELFRWPLAVGTFLLGLGQVILGLFLRILP